jgi:hypothetical protein
MQCLTGITQMETGTASIHPMRIRDGKETAVIRKA